MEQTQSRRRLFFVCFFALTVAFALLAGPGRAQASDPPFLGWSAVLPPLQTEYDPGSEDACISGKTSCVDKTVREMTRKFDDLASSCNHNAIFSLAYLRTTEEYRRTIDDPTFFEDTPFVNHEDRVFADYYFNAYDDYYGGHRERVPPAWRIAFKAADNRSVSAAGDLFLGMNAHINRDLPFVLYGIGLVKPDGTSRKPDHDKVNEFLNRVLDNLLPEIADRFDPTIDDTNLPGPVDDFLEFQAIPTWREMAWRNAERLANADSAAEREQVAQSIEDYAVQQAQDFKLLTSYGLLGNSNARDAYCAVHHG